MKSTGEIGLKITAAQRDYFRYTGRSAEVERQGAGCSRPALAWVVRLKREAEERGSAIPAKKPANKNDQA
jgi:hypothetical protein